ncbi:hypothetical protein D3C86_1577430 [compost metagenome]
MPGVAVPSGSSMRASTMASAASGLEQNLLSPTSRQPPSTLSSRIARVAVAATSEPAPCSVMNIAPWYRSSKTCVVRLGR